MSFILTILLQRFAHRRRDSGGWLHNSSRGRGNKRRAPLDCRGGEPRQGHPPRQGRRPIPPRSLVTTCHTRPKNERGRQLEIMQMNKTADGVFVPQSTVSTRQSSRSRMDSRVFWQNVWQAQANPSRNRTESARNFIKHMRRHCGDGLLLVPSVVTTS
jgi:hypothetical protein